MGGPLGVDVGSRGRWELNGVGRKGGEGGAPKGDPKPRRSGGSEGWRVRRVGGSEGGGCEHCLCVSFLVVVFGVMGGWRSNPTAISLTFCGGCSWTHAGRQRIVMQFCGQHKQVACGSVKTTRHTQPG